MKLWPWNISNRPKTFGKALSIMIASNKFNLTERSLAIAAGVSRYDIFAFIEGNQFPSKAELRDIAGAFILNYFNRVLIKERQLLIDEFTIILEKNERYK